MVDDAEVEAGLAALVLGPDPFQLVLARRHLHQAGVGVDEDAVEVVHLNVGFQPDLLFAAQGAARRGGEGADPLPAVFQRREPGRVLAVLGGCVPVGHQPGVEGLFGGGQLAAGGLQLRLPGLQCCQLLRGQRIFRSLLGLQCADGGLGSGRRLLGLRRLRFQCSALVGQLLALGFQLGAAFRLGSIFSLLCVQSVQCPAQGSMLLG